MAATEMTRATTKQVREHYKALGYEVRISKDGRVNYCVAAHNAIWKEGRYVSEYLVVDNTVVLK